MNTKPTSENTAKGKALLVIAVMYALFITEAFASPTDPLHRILSLQGSKHTKAVVQEGRLRQVSSLPGTSMNYLPDSSGGWSHFSNSTYTYDALGRLIEQVDIMPGSNLNMTRKVNVYDSRGNLTEELNYEWLNLTWTLDSFTPSRKRLLTYNSSNKITNEIIQIFVPAAGDFINSTRTETTYDAFGNSSQKIYSEWVNPGWSILGRDLLMHNTSNELAEIIIQEYIPSMSIYLTTFKVSDMAWHNFANDQISSWKLSQFDGVSYTLLSRGTVTYDPNGGSVRLVEEPGAGNSWIPRMRETTFFDVNSNYIGWKEEIHDSNAWVRMSEYQEVLTYNANLDIIERVFRSATDPNHSLTDNRKETYDNFISSTQADVLSPINVYPNPASDALQVNSSFPGSFSVTITDLAGRQILAMPVLNPRQNINVSKLPTGTYLLTITYPSFSKRVRFVKY